MDSWPEQSNVAQESDPSGEEPEGTSIDHVKVSLSKHIASIREERAWSSYGPILSNSPTPGLYLKDGVVVGLPLSPHDALRIKRHSSQSSGSYKNGGLGCELSPSQFEIRNPAWHAFVQSVSLKATKPLDIGTVHVNLRTLVLCDKSSGPFVQEEPSKDSDIIAWMAIVLSSHHEGGDITFSFGNERQCCSTALTSHFNESFIAWYSDVQVDSEPITSGYRLQLMYDLHHAPKIPSGKPSAFQLYKQVNEFRDLLGQWRTLSERREGPVPLVWLLDDDLKGYKHRPLSCTSLTDADKHKLLFLQRQCNEKDVHVFLATLTASIDDDLAVDDDVSNTTMELHDITDLDGHIFVKQEVSIGKENLVLEDWFDERPPNNSEYDTSESLDPWEEVEPRSDENVRHFKYWAFMMLPASQRLKFLANNTSPEDLQSWIVRLSDILQHSDNIGTHPLNGLLPRPREELKAELDSFCGRAMDRMQSWRRYNIGLTSYLYHHENPNFAEALEAVVRGSLILGNTNLVHEAMIECPAKLSASLWRQVGGWLDRSTLEKYKHGLNLALRQIPTIYEKNLALESIVLGYRNTSREALQEHILDRWVQDRLEEALSTLEIVGEKDAKALISISKMHGRELFLNQVTPFAKRHASNLPFAADFVTGICEEVVAEPFDPDIVRLALREVFSVIIPAFAIEKCKVSAKRRKIVRTSTTSVGYEDTDRWSLTGSRIARLIDCCLAFNLGMEEERLLNRIASEASNADDRTLSVILIPFLQDLRQIMEKHGVPLMTQHYQNSFQYIINLFITEYVKPEPPRPANQTCPKAGCGAGRQCQDCWDLDNFLEHPIQKCWDLTTTGQRRDHVEGRVLANQSPFFHCDTIRNHHAPHTLRVAKTLNETWEASHSAWLSRCAQAKEMLASIGHKALEQLLGNKYDECFELRSVLADERIGKQGGR